MAPDRGTRHEEISLTRTAPAPPADQDRGAERAVVAGSRRRTRLAWVGLVAGLAGVQLALLWRRFYYGNDDLLQFEVARSAGLSWEMLTLNVFQHVAPYNRLGHLLVAQADMAPAVGMAFMTLNLVALLAAALWFMTELGLPTGRRVLALVLIGLSVSVSESALWFDTSMHILAALAVTLAVCAAHVRGVRTGATRWHVLALVLFVAGQLTQERPVFALPLLVLADVFLLWRDLPWRERWRRLWGLRWPLVSLTVAAAGIALWLQAYVVQDGGTTPSWATTGETMLLALTGYVLPSLLNVPVADGPSTAVQVAVLVGAVAVGVVLGRLRRGNAGPLVFAAAAFLLYYGFLKLSPLLQDTPESIQGNAERLHYVVYVTVPLVIALVHLRLPVPRRLRSGAWAHRLAGLAIVLLAGWLTVSGNAYLDRRWAETTESRAYMDAVRAQAAEWSDPDVTLLPLWAHPAMATSWAASYARHDRLLDLVVPGFRTGDLGPDPVVIDDTGAVRPARLVTVPGRVTVEEGGCATRSAPRVPTDVVVRADVARTLDPSFLVVRYRAREAVDIQVVTDAGRGGQEGYVTATLPAGDRARVLPMQDPDVRTLVLSTVAPASMCVIDARVVDVVVVGDDGECRDVDRLGHIGAITRCR